MDFRQTAKSFSDPEALAEKYISHHFGNEKIEYPINPFALLKGEGILFRLADFKKLEGIYIPAGSENDTPFVGINGNRPITRMRFTAAHELCHHLRDADKEITCPIGNKNAIEKFADAFAAAILMPLKELKAQILKRIGDSETISFDDVLEIADYFGVSFESCLFRIAYRIHVIEGDTEPNALRKRISKYQPDKVREQHHLTYVKLYSGLIDIYKEQLVFEPNDYARFLFQNEYIYNDSRMEDVDVEIEQASEIVTDLRLHTQNSEYCVEENEPFLSIAGHYSMYQDIFTEPSKDTVSVYDMFLLNKKLFSYYPHPEFGGSVRQSNTLVIGGKFETVDYHSIYSELGKLDMDVKEYFLNRDGMSPSCFIKNVVKTHHQITVIHPFADGNGRTSRAFLNLELIQAGLSPAYIKVEDKQAYISALSRADKDGDYDELYEVFFKAIIKSHLDLSRTMSI